MYYADGNGDYYSTTKLLNYAKYRDNINSKPLYTIYSDIVLKIHYILITKADESEISSVKLEDIICMRMK